MTIDEYIAGFPPGTQELLRKVRLTIRAAVPDAEETISYQIPTLKVEGRHVIYFAGWKNHISVYPIPAGDKAFEDEVAPYRAAKGTLKFPLTKPIPYELIGRVAERLLQQR
jgi:uncharacterized protein YdhG (YjbR/CyaY superfamily)